MRPVCWHQASAVPQREVLWVRLAEPPEPEGPGYPPADDRPEAIVLIQPVMSLDASRLALDSGGQVVRYDQRWDSDQPTGVIWSTARRVSRQQLLSTASGNSASLAAGIAQLEQELLTYE